MANNNLNGNTGRRFNNICASGSISQTCCDENEVDVYNTRCSPNSYQIYGVDDRGLNASFKRSEERVATRSLLSTPNETHNRVSPLRRTNSFRDRRDVDNRELLNILDKKYTKNDSQNAKETSISTKRASANISGETISPLRRTQSLRERNQKRPTEMTSPDLGFSLMNVLRDDLENLRRPTNGSNIERLERRRGSDIGEDSSCFFDIPPDIPPRISHRSRLQDRFQTLRGVPENMATDMPIRRRQASVENIRLNRIENRWPSNEDVSMGSTGNLSVQSYSSSGLDDTSQSHNRISYASKFKDMLHETHRNMFESIGRELIPNRHQTSDRSSALRYNQTGSLVDLSDNSPVYRQGFDAGNALRIDELRNGTAPVESRAKRVMSRLQRSTSDVSTVDSFQNRYQKIPDRPSSVIETRTIDQARGFHEHSRIGGRYNNVKKHSEYMVQERASSSEEISRNMRVNSHIYEREADVQSEQYRTVISERKKDVVSGTLSTRKDQMDIDNVLESGKVKELLQVGKIEPRTPSGRRKLILDEQKLHELFLKCHVCHETYNTGDKLPKLMPCHHTFCLSCLVEMHKIETDHRKNMTVAYRAHMPTAIRLACPSCRDAILVTSEELIKLPDDRTVVALLEVVVQSEACVVSYCSKHQTQPLNFFCETCILPVCCDCTVLEHSQQDGHVVQNIEEALKKYVPMIETTLDGLDDHYAELVKYKSDVETASTCLKTNTDDVTSKLKETFAHFRSAADDRQEEMVEIIEREIKKRKDELCGLLEVVTKRRRQLMLAKSRVALAQEEMNVEDVFRYNNELVEQIDDFVDIPKSFDNDIDTHLEFDIEEQKAVNNKLLQFGDVSFEVHEVREA